MMMRVFYGLAQFPKSLRCPIAALGSFDGLHLGHQKILREVVQRARKKKETSLLITFDPHPVKVLRPRQFLPLLTCLPHRLKLLSKTGLSVCWVIPFSRPFSRLSAEAFVKRILVERMKISEIWVGFDVTFGRDRKGSFLLLRRLGKRYGFKVFQVPKVCIARERVSSSRIRHFVEKGDLAKAARFLGRPFSIHGKVVHGSKRGRTFKRPTANLKVCEQILPPLGVYAVWVPLKGLSPQGTVPGYWGLLNLGKRPTFSQSRKTPVAEVHLLDFRGRLYGRELEVFFVRRIRNEKRFLTAQALGKQIRKDERKVRSWIARREIAPPPLTVPQTQKGRPG